MKNGPDCFGLRATRRALPSEKGFKAILREEKATGAKAKIGRSKKESSSILHAAAYFVQQHTLEPAAYLKYEVPGNILEVCGRILQVCGPDSILEVCGRGPGPPNTFVLVINSLSCNNIQESGPYNCYQSLSAHSVKLATDFFDSKDILKQKFNMINHVRGENLEAQINRFTQLMTKMKSAEIELAKGEINKRLLISLPITWNFNCTAIKRTKDMYQTSLSELISILYSYDMDDKQCHLNHISSMDVSEIVEASTSTSGESKALVSQQDWSDKVQDLKVKQHHDFVVEVTDTEVIKDLCSAICVEKVNRYEHDNDILNQEITKLRYSNSEHKRLERVFNDTIEASKNDFSKHEMDFSNKECLYRDALKRIDDLSLKLNNAVTQLANIKLTIEKIEHSRSVVYDMIVSQVRKKGNPGIGYHAVEHPFNGNFTLMPSIQHEDVEMEYGVGCKPDQPSSSKQSMSMIASPVLECVNVTNQSKSCAVTGLVEGIVEECGSDEEEDGCIFESKSASFKKNCLVFKMVTSQRATQREKYYSKPMKVEKPKAMKNKHPKVKPSDNDWNAAKNKQKVFRTAKEDCQQPMISMKDTVTNGTLCFEDDINV
ncbi:hypothetical protein L1987_27945 [Smallanthus sonchifolius]|uniref:Uncharacterized protein n=1 Tax=Smallanthus sonchifolius TaxID=185202 RepID=A0ACB9IB84_9ASTR|nr:hypothetical protein L1987_27945 [Smallanthus sonchifolius]